jgi:hypothetical protein
MVFRAYVLRQKLRSAGVKEKGILVQPRFIVTDL